MIYAVPSTESPDAAVLNLLQRAALALSFTPLPGVKEEPVLHGVYNKVELDERGTHGWAVSNWWFRKESQPAMF